MEVELHHAAAWGCFLAFVMVMLAFDLFVLHRKPRKISLPEALLGTLVPILAAGLFAVVLYLAYQNHWLDLGQIPPHTPVAAQEFYPDTGVAAVLLFVTGYVVELSLSADNVFLFIVLMTFFAVPLALQHRVLFWGVVGALVLRGIMILAGSVLLAQFSWLIYLFGGFILYAGINMFFSGSEEKDPAKSLAVRLARKFLPIHPGYDGGKFITTINGKRFATTLLLVLIAIEFTDLVFALDSIPAIFGITKDPFIVFTSNIFAILGLRSMYFLLKGVIQRFHLLRYGLAFVLAFVGLKMILPGAGYVYGRFVSGREPDWRLNPYLSLAIILGALLLTVIASLIVPPRRKIVYRSGADQ